MQYSNDTSEENNTLNGHANSYSQKFCNIYRITPVLESLFNNFLQISGLISY